MHTAGGDKQLNVMCFRVHPVKGSLSSPPPFTINDQSWESFSLTANLSFHNEHQGQVHGRSKEKKEKRDYSIQCTQIN